MSGKPTRRPGERAFAAALLAFSLAAFWQAFDISGFQGLSTAGMFPMLASGTMVVASALFTAKTLTSPGDTGPLSARLMHFQAAILPYRHVLMIALILAYVLVMPWLGFVVASALFLFASIQLLWRRKPYITLAVTVLALVVIHFIFRVVFQVVLPQGTLLRGMF